MEKNECQIQPQENDEFQPATVIELDGLLDQMLDENGGGGEPKAWSCIAYTC